MWAAITKIHTGCLKQQTLLLIALEAEKSKINTLGDLGEDLLPDM